MLWAWLDWITIIVLQVVGVLAAVHALMHKDEPRAALAWIAVCLAVPGVGVALYVLFGVNRISTQARHLEHRGLKDADALYVTQTRDIFSWPETHSFRQRTFEVLVRTSERVCNLPLERGCRVRTLQDGTQAYPRMLAAIDAAQHSVYLSTYIFGTYGIGARFIRALQAAHHRGVRVRVLVDGVGCYYSWPPAHRVLRRLGVPCALFLSPLKNPFYTIHLNLRNHRKIMLVDGVLGFTGGINIRDANYAIPGRPAKVHDIHFEVSGPICGQLEDVFKHDWEFATGETLLRAYRAPLQAPGSALCRSIVSSPSAPYTKLQWILLAALNAATERIRIMTPYFILGQDILAAISAAALRGVTVEVVLPRKNNLPFVKWAAETQFTRLIEQGVRIYYRPGFFAHTKLLLVDDFCAYIGSANLDSRSLRLNFEFNLEVFSRSTVSELNAHFDTVLAESQPIALHWLARRPFWVNFRNAFFRLFSPYL